MAILFMGTSLADVGLTTGGAVVTTTGANIDTYVSEGIRNGLGNTLEIFFPPEDDFWFSFYFNWVSTSGGAGLGIGIFSAAGDELFRFNGVGNSSTGALRYHNGTVLTTTDQVTGGSYTGLHRVDIHIKIADTGGIFEVYRDGVLDMTLAGVTTDTLRTSATELGRIVCRSFGLAHNDYSGMIIGNEDTRGYRLNQALPNGAGATTGWTGAYTTVDETGFNDADSASTGTLNALSTFAFPAAHADFNTGAWTVRAVAVGFRGVAPHDGSLDIAGVVRTASTDYASAGLDVPPAYRGMTAIWDVNPNTGVDWLFADASAAQVGVKAV